MKRLFPRGGGGTLKEHTAKHISFETPLVKQPFINHHCFPAHHMQSYLLRSDSLVVRGLEPFQEEWREARYEYLITQPSAQLRYALLCDTGAPDNAAGLEWLEAYTQHHGSHVVKTKFRSQLSGIGEGNAKINEKWRFPVGLVDVENDLYEGLWEAQCLEGIGKGVPPLWGLSSQISQGVMFDFTNKDHLKCSMQLSQEKTNRTVFTLINHHGHILLPIDWGGHPYRAKKSLLQTI